MTGNNPAKLSSLVLITAVLSITSSACSKQNWYLGAQAGKQAQCMKGPDAEYENCMQQSNGSYDEYKKNRDDLLNEPVTNK